MEGEVNPSLCFFFKVLAGNQLKSDFDVFDFLLHGLLNI